MFLTDADLDILPRVLRVNGGFHIGTHWFLREWDPLPYQYAFHHATQMNTTLIAGIASGKTTIVAASNFIDCITTPYFKALNTSVTAKQAELAFEMAMTWIEGNSKVEHHIKDIKLRPYPKIMWQNFSEWDFRTAGTDARFIRGSEYDRIGYDEAGLDTVGESVKVLRGRLRGVRADQTVRMARMDVFTSPTDAQWLRERYKRGMTDSGTTDLKRYLSFRIETYDNTRLTKEQISAMEAEYPPEMIDVELRGFFPDYGFSMFPSGHLNACQDQSLYDAAYLALNPEDVKTTVKKGYHLEEDPRHGIIHYEVPPVPGHIYIMGGDPGMGNYPARNAPCVIVVDCTDNTNKVMVYFSWISGKGSYTPFLTSYKHAINKYNPVLRGIDATGTQRALDELAFENMGIKTDRLNFTTEKTGMLNALSMDITSHRFRFPPIKGLRQQMGQYTLEADKKLPQDIVMTLAEIAYLARYVPDAPDEKAMASANYRVRKLRSRTQRRRRR